MAGPASPNEGPTFEPPALPPGWIAQWDGSSKKYYYVQLSTGVSQWETPTQAAPGGTPAQVSEHPYGVPGRRELITHPDGSQTLRHPDGRMEPVLPVDGSRGVPGGPDGERGFGSFAANSLLNQFVGGHGKPQNGSGHGGSSSSGGFGNLAGQLIGGLGGSHGSSSGGSSGAHGTQSGGGMPGKLVGQLASNLFSSGNKPPSSGSYHSGQTSQPSHHGGGLAGSVMGGVANIFGGGHHGQSGQSYGYSNAGQSNQAGGYSGQAPPTSYQPPNGSTPAYSSPPTTQHGSTHGSTSYSHPPSQHSTPPYTPSQQTAPSYNAPQSQHGVPSFPPPPGQHGASYPTAPAPPGGHQTPSYGGVPSSTGPQSGYGHSPVSQGHGYPQQHHQYSSPPSNQPQYSSHQQYPPPPSTYPQQYPPPPSSAPTQYSGQPSYASAGPAVPTGIHPHQGQVTGHGGYPGNW
ncbi:hypothetical protein F5X96DRAFT_667378 [Biscogniauxia mediterranea]|nr:hypothetical protein F5X96DRAFT_667378 [Biscogniauxia mediterranea]